MIGLALVLLLFPSVQEAGADPIVELERQVATLEETEGSDSPELADALNHLGLAHYRLQQFSEARGPLERALEIRERVLGEEHRDTAKTLNNLAITMQDLGDLEAARRYGERAVAASEATAGPDHHETATALSNLAGILLALDEPDAARPLMERGVEIFEAIDPEAPELIGAHSKLVSLLTSEGDFAAAQVHAERMVAISEKVLGPEHPHTATSLSNLAGTLENQGQLTEARPLYERALAIRERAFGPENPATAGSMTRLATLLRRLGDFEAARPLAERALEVRESVLGSEHPLTAEGLTDVAEILVGQGELAAARPLYERSLAIYEAALGPRHRLTANALNNLGNVLRELGELEESDEAFRRALAISSETSGWDHPGTCRILGNLALLQHYRGALVESRSSYESAHRGLEKALGPEHPATIKTLNNLANLVREQGDAVAARPLYERVISTSEARLGAEHPDTLMGWHNLAGVLEDLGELDEARRILERVLAIRERELGPRNPITVTTLNNLVTVMRHQGESAAALPLAERVLAAREEELGSRSPFVAASLVQLAGLLGELGETGEARASYVRAMAIEEDVLGPRHPEAAHTWSSLATLLRREGELAAARDLRERALGVYDEVLGPENPRTVAERSRFALLLADAGELERARDELVGSHRVSLESVLGGLTEREQFQYLARLRWQLEGRLSLCVSDDPAVLVAGYDGLLGWKGGVGRTLVASREQLARDLTEEQRKVVGDLRACQSRLARALAGGDASPDELQELGRQRNALELEVARSLESSATDALTSDELRAALPPRTAVVDFFVQRLYEPGEPGAWSEEHVVAWITRRDRDLVRVDLGPSTELERAVEDHLRHLPRSSTGGLAQRGVAAAGAPVGEKSERLRPLLWDSLAPHLEDVDTLFVSPDGALGTLPFETLELEDGSHLVEDLAIVYLADVTTLARNPEPPAAVTGSLLAVGDVDFDRPATSIAKRGDPLGKLPPGSALRALRGGVGTSWGPLPATGHEVRAIQELAKSAGIESVVVTGTRAMEDSLKPALERHRVLHLATHGFFNPEGMPTMWDPSARTEEASHLVGRHPGLLSGLVCAGANAEAPELADDGYLTAEEVGWLDLSGADLVVMSACETGLGRAASGEGLIGLRRAFRTAGAKTVISSLWQVEDESTAELMRAFYENLWVNGMGRLEALRSAQLAMLARNREEHGDALPHTWGAFVLSGEWR